MKRIVNIILICAALLGGAKALAADSGKTVYIRPDGADGKMKVVVNMPDSFASRQMFVYVLKPGAEISNITDMDSAKNTGIFEFFGQAEYKSGGLEFTFKMNTDGVNESLEPVYTLYAADDTGESLTFEYTYISESEKESLLPLIRSKAVTASIADRIYKAFSLQYIDLYNSADKSVTAEKINAFSNADTTLEQVEEIFADACIMARTKTDGLTVADIEKYNGFIGLGDEFTNEFANLSANGELYFKDYSKINAESMQQLKTNLEKVTLAALIYGNKLEGAGVLAKVVKNHESYFAASGIDIAAFDKSAKDVTGKKLLSESRRDFDGIIEVIKDSLKKTSQSGSGSGGSGGSSGSSSKGSSSGSGSGGSAVPAVKPSNEKTESFSDLGEAEWARDSIEKLFQKGIVSGKEIGKFKPNDTITREEFVKMICGAFELQRGTKTVIFSDVPADRWSYDAIMTAASCGVVSGYGDNFNPSELIKREDIAAILVRAVNHKNIDMKIDSYDVPFTDAEEISEYAKESVNILYQNKIISGRDDGRFAPRDNATRAEAAKMICGALGL